MSSILQSPFKADSIQEVVPHVAKVAGKLSSASVITGRRRVKIVPQSGMNYTLGSGGSSVVNFLIQDGQAYADLLSACLSFKVAVASTTPADAVVLDDGAYSVFRRCMVSVNSTLADDVDWLAKKVNSEIYATVDQSWYNTVGSFMGLWKHNTVEFGYVGTASGTPATAIIPKYDVGRKINEYRKRVNPTGTGTTGSPMIPGGNKFSIPVCMLTSFFRNETLFPSRNAGQLYLQLNLASVAEALLSSGAVAGTPSITVSDLTLEMDFVDLHPTYLALMDELMEKPDESGVLWAYDAHLSASQNILSGAGQQSIVVSKASQNLRSIQVIAQSQAGLANTTYAKQSAFMNPGLVDIQYRVGSQYYPSFPSIGEHRCFMDLQNAFGSPASLDKSGVIDAFNYYLTTNAAASACTANNEGTAVNQPTYLANSDCWTHAYCFDKLKHAELDGVNLDGINTLTSSGSQIVVQLNANVPENAVITAFVRYTRVLQLANGATRIIG